MTRFIGAACLALFVAACGPSSAGSPRSAITADVGRIQAVLAQDPASTAMAAVDDAVADDLPVRAADLLAERLLPRLREHLRRLERVELTTPEARAVLAAVARAHRQRLTALERYQVVLSRGIVEDLALAEALGAQRRAEQAVADGYAALEVLRRGDTGTDGR